MITKHRYKNVNPLNKKVKLFIILVLNVKIRANINKEIMKAVETNVDFITILASFSFNNYHLNQGTQWPAAYRRI